MSTVLHCRLTGVNGRTRDIRHLSMMFREDKQICQPQCTMFNENRKSNYLVILMVLDALLLIAELRCTIVSSGRGGERRGSRRGSMFTLAQ